MSEYDDPDPRTRDGMTISLFSRRVGLTPSALRFYDDAGLLTPAYVDPTTGYRYYLSEQEPRAMVLRDLREVEVPLADARVVLDGGPSEAADVLRAHLRGFEDKLAPTRATVHRLLAALPVGDSRCDVTLDGPELASAVRQVVPATGWHEEHPALDCVLVELDSDEVTLVGTDRHQLAIRVLRGHRFAGAPTQVLVPATELAAIGPELMRHEDVSLMVDGSRLTVLLGEESREVPTRDDTFWDYREMLAGLLPWTTQVIVDRAWLRGCMIDAADATVVRVRLGGDQMEVRLPGEPRTHAAITVGQEVVVGFTPALLATVLDSSVGPDVLLQLRGPAGPVVVRSADQGTFTTLAMPYRLGAADER